MAKTDAIISEIDKILSSDVEYKQPMKSDLFIKMAKNLNFMCSILENMKCDVLPFGTTSWTAPDNIVFAVAFGISGGGGGGGSAPASLGGGINNSTLYIGSNGNKGGNTTFNGQLVAEGGDGGEAFRFRANFDDGGSGGGGLSPLPLNPQCSDNRDTIKGLIPPIGGRGAYQTGQFPGNNGHLYGLGSAFGGEAGRVGILPLTNLIGGNTYPVSIGSGGAGGANHPFTATQCSNLGIPLFNSLAGGNSPGMAIFCLGF